MSTVEREVSALRAWRHDIPNQLLIPIQDELSGMRQLIHQLVSTTPKPDASTKPAPLTMRDFWVAFGSVGATVTVLQFLGRVGGGG